jgi:hypothetical protein
MKALFIPEGDSYAIELVAESQEDRENLLKYWNNDSMSVSCEEWREMSDEAKA